MAIADYTLVGAKRIVDPAVSCFVAVLALTCSQVGAEGNLPGGAHKVIVTWPHEVSGVAVIDGGYLVVGDENPKHYYTWPQGTAHEVWSADKSRVCDGEAIDVGYGPDGRQIHLLLGEDFHTVYIRGSSPIRLPEAFSEQCKRGVEGLSVRWSNGGWDLAVMWEGGIPDKKHSPNERKSKKCKPVRKVNCPLDLEPRDALVALYRLSADLTSVTHGKTITLETSRLLEIEEPEEVFRATDLTWYGDQLLVLLGSMPLPGVKGAVHRRTWIQGFGLDGSLNETMQLRLEDLWKNYRKGKNWEAMDTTLDGRRLVLGYDIDGTSELVVFDPGFSTLR